MLLRPSESRQARLIEQNLKNAFIAMSNEQKHYGKSQYVFSNIPHPIFNCVIEAKTTEPEIEQTIKAIWEEYRKNNVAHCWWISERSQPKDFAKHLQNLNFQKGPKYRGMHAVLKDINLEIPASSNIRIEQIRHVEAFDAWVKPLAESFEFSEEVSIAFAKCYKDLFVKSNQLISYIAFYDHEPAGCSTLFLDEDCAGLYNGAVFPKFRNKGVITHLGKTMLLEAKNQGVEDVVVHVNNASHDISIKAGFKQYLNIEAYLSPSTPK